MIVSTTGSLMRIRIQCTTTPSTMPTTRPTPIARPKMPRSCQTVSEVPATMGVNTRTRVSEAASLIRLSPDSTVMTLRGSPSFRPIAAADTASGGATIAPSRIAAGSVMSGMSRYATPPTTRAVTITRKMPSRRICLIEPRKFCHDTSRAAE